MTIADLGGLDVAGAVPGAQLAVTAGTTGINTALPNLQGQLDALLAFTPTAVSFVADLAVAQQMVIGIQLAITLGLPEPTILEQHAAIAAAIADITALLATMNAQLTAINALVAPLAVGGLHAWAYSGASGASGGEIGAAISGEFPADTVDAVIIATATPAAFTALGAIVKVAP